MIGVALDLDSVPNRLLFGLNGEWAAPMGVAFEGISFDQHIFPALTATGGTSVRVNFGGGVGASTAFVFGPPDPSFRCWGSPAPAGGAA